MGQIELPQCAVADVSIPKAVSEVVQADLTGCWSPLSQWEQPMFFPSGKDQTSVQPTEFEPIPDAFAVQHSEVTDGDQINMQRVELLPLTAFMPHAASLQTPCVPTTPVGFAAEPGPCVYVMPIITPQQHNSLPPMDVSDLGFLSHQVDGLAWPIEPIQICNEIRIGDELHSNPDCPDLSSGHNEVGDADSYVAESTGPRLSASAARRRRRQRAAMLRAQQQVFYEPCVYQGEPMKISVPKDSQRVKMSRAELLARLETGGEGLPEVLAEIVGLARQLTFEAEGCRVVQLALEKADNQDRARLCAELHGCVRRAIASPHGNYVIQRVVELMPAPLSSFVSLELFGVGAEIARHRFGCRIMCRLLEHSSSQPLTTQLIDEALQEARELCCHNFAHHVIESTLEHGTADQRHRIALALQGDPFAYATDSYATYVIESALRNCSHADRHAIGATFLADKDGVVLLAEHNLGLHVVRALLKYSEQRLSIAALLREERFRLQTSDNGSRTLSLSYQVA